MNAIEVWKALVEHATNRTGDVHDLAFISLCKMADEMGIPSVKARATEMSRRPRVMRAHQNLEWITLGVVVGFVAGMTPEAYVRGETPGTDPPKIGGC